MCQFNHKKYLEKSRIGYSGNGNYGHYTCIREYGQKKIVFNDSLVYEYKDNSSQYYFGNWRPSLPSNRMCLYELTNCNDVSNNSKQCIKQAKNQKINKVEKPIINGFNQSISTLHYWQGHPS